MFFINDFSMSGMDCVGTIRAVFSVTEYLLPTLLSHDNWVSSDFGWPVKDNIGAVKKKNIRILKSSL